jgi:hypothetical protein
VLVAVIVVVCLVGLGITLTFVDTDPPEDEVIVSESSPVEALIPPEGSEILRQEPVGVDLRPGWTGTLVVNDQEIPNGQLQTDNLESLGQILYTPGDGKVVERYDAGQNCATAIIWRVEESRASSRTVSWCFNVT